MSSSSKHPPQVALFINGEKVFSKSANFRNITNPATQEVIAVVPFATVDEVNAALIRNIVITHTKKMIFCTIILIITNNVQLITR